MCRLEEDSRVINRNKYIEKNLCMTLVIYQESLKMKMLMEALEW